MNARVTGLALLIALLVACSSTKFVDAPTQVLLRLSSGDGELLRRASSVRITVSSFESGSYRDKPAVDIEVRTASWPLEIPIYPRRGSDDARTFQVIAQAYERDQLLAETRAVARFSPGRHKLLERELFLCPGHEAGFVCSDAECRGEDCLVCSTRGTCEPVGVRDELPDEPTQTSEDGVDPAGLDAGADDREDDRDVRAPSADAGTDADSAIDAGSTMDAAADGARDSGIAQPDASSSTDAGTPDASLVDAAPPELCNPSTLVRCGQTCVDLNSDAANCGRCGRACRSNTCGAGACAATSIYTHAPSNPDAGTFISSGLAIDAPFVYFQSPTSNEVQRVTTSGSTPTLVSYSAPDNLSYFRIDSGYLYASAFSTTGPNVLRMALSSDAFGSIMGSQNPYVLGLTTNTNQVFIVATLSRTYIQAIAKTGATMFTMLASGPSYLYEVEADDTNVFFRDSAAILRGSAVSETTPVAVAAFESGEACRDMTLTSDKLVFASSQRVAIVAKTGGPVTTLASRSAHMVLTDARYAYYSHELGSDKCVSGVEIYRVPLAGGASERLTTDAATCRLGNCCISSLLQDSAALYWLRGDGRVIRRVEK